MSTTRLYSNLPIETTATKDSTNVTRKYFDRYLNVPVNIDTNFRDPIRTFFEKRGFASASADHITLILLTQAKKDNINPQNLIDTLSGLDSVEISGLVAEILNYNRFKSSTLGSYLNSVPADEIQRNILA